jgi:hypothetical protein
MHVPVQIHIENIEQAITALLVAVSTYRVEKVLNYNVTTDDRVHRPVVALKLRYVGMR